MDVGKSLTITTDAAGTIQTNSFNVSTNISGQGSGTVTVPVGPNKARDVTAFAPLDVQGEAIVYSVDNQIPEVENKVASVGQYSAGMPITVKTRITENGKNVDPKTATSLNGDIEVEWEFTNHTTSNQQISYRGPSGVTVSETVPISIPFGVGITGTFGSGWADIVAPWGNTGFAVGQVMSGSVALKDSTVIAKLTGTAHDAQLPEMKIKASPADSTNATSALYSKGADIGAKVDDALEGKGVPLLLKLQAGLGKASTGIAAFLDKNVNPILDLTAKLKVDPASADKKINALVNQLGDASDYLFLLNGMTESATGKIASQVAVATSPASQQTLEKFIAGLGQADTTLDAAIVQLKKVLADMPDTIKGLNATVGFPDNLVCSQTPCTGEDLVEKQIIALLPTSCTSGDATRTYLNTGSNWTDIVAAIDAAPASADLTELKDLLAAQKAGTWDVGGCQTAAAGVKKATPILIGDLREISTDLAELLPLLNDVDNGIKVAEKSLTKFLAQMPTINYQLDHECSPAVISNISQCGLVQAMEIAANADEATAKEVRKGLRIIVRTLQVPLNQIFAVANDIGRASLPLERTLNDLPGVIDELGNGPFGSFTSEVEGLAGLASKLTTSASKTVAINNAIDQKFNSGEAFPYGSATGAGAKTSATYSFAVSAPGSTGVPLWLVGTFAGILAVMMLGVAIWLSRRPGAV